jgi:hypothetical protein
MKILALPINRESLIAAEALPYYAELLSLQLEAFSEESASAAWVPGIEFDVWLQTKEEPASHPARWQLSAEAHQRFKALGDFMGGWVIRLDTGDFMYMPEVAFFQHLRNTQSTEYVERFRQWAVAHLSSTLNTKRTNTVEVPSEDELNRIIDEAREEIEDEKRRGTHVEPIACKRDREAREAYNTWWRETSLRLHSP